MSFAYSKNIHERFSKVDQDSSQASIDWYETNSTTSDLMPPSLNITEDSYNPFHINKKRYIFYSFFELKFIIFLLNIWNFNIISNINYF